MEIKDLFLRHQSVATAGFSSGAYKPGLDAMRRMDAILENPSRKFRSIHVAGTNGKGSVSSMLAASIASSGLRVGLYTSPHLLDFRERMKIVSGGGFGMIPPEEVQYFLDTYEKDMEGLTFFEVTTGMAFWWFAKERVDIAVIETGRQTRQHQHHNPGDFGHHEHRAGSLRTARRHQGADCVGKGRDLQERRPRPRMGARSGDRPSIHEGGRGGGMSAALRRLHSFTVR